MRSERSTRCSRLHGHSVSSSASSRAGASIRPGAFCILLVAYLPGCDARSGASRGGGDSPVVASASLPVTDQRADSLVLELVVPAEVRVGHAFDITMRVRNLSARPRDLALQGRTPTLDVIVSRPNGDTVWQRLRDEVVPAVLALRTLGPGEVLTVEARWDQRTLDGTPAPPGEYLARGLLLTDDEPLATAQIAFRIQGR